MCPRHVTSQVTHSCQLSACSHAPEKETAKKARFPLSNLDASSRALLNLRMSLL